jgi:hypothetical protein
VIALAKQHHQSREPSQKRYFLLQAPQKDHSCNNYVRYLFESRLYWKEDYKGKQNTMRNEHHLLEAL